MALPLGILDQSPVLAGSDAEAAIGATVALARRADELGYARYWFAEHHGREFAYASASPEVLIANVSAQTRRMRLGSGGVLLAHYSPLKVAESFRLLEALAPGRIDLGIGGGTGSDDDTARALHSAAGADGVYAERLTELFGFLEKRSGDAPPHAGVVASPVSPHTPQTWILGSSAKGARVAGALGRPFAYAHFIKGDGIDAVAAYREAFQPSARTARPTVLLTVAAFCSDDAAERDDYLTTLCMRRARMRSEHDPLPPSPAEAHAYTPTAEERVTYAETRRLAVVADRGSIRARLEEIARRHGAEEVMIVTVAPSYDLRTRSYEAMADAFH